jgi:hypothetical protein
MVDRRMTNDDLTARLTEVLVAAQRRYRTQRGWGALTSVRAELQGAGEGR